MPASSARRGSAQVDGDRFRREALAAALDSEEKQSLGRVEGRLELVAGAGLRLKADPARRDPLLELLEAPDLIQTLGRRHELEEPASLDERLFRLADARTVGGRQRVVLHDRPRKGALRLEHGQARQVRHDAVGVLPGEGDLDARVVPGGAPRNPLEEVGKLARPGQGELEADLEIVELGPRRNRRADDDEGARGAGELLGRLAQQPKRRRRLQVRRGVLEEEGAVASRLANQAQRRGEIHRLFGLGRVRRGKAARGAPGPVRDRQVARNQAQQRLESLLLDRLADDQGVARLQEKGQVSGDDVQTVPQCSERCVGRGVRE